MRTDLVASVGIDDSGALWVKPETVTFPYIFIGTPSVGAFTLRGRASGLTLLGSGR